jgi:hypothetical protein
MVPIQYFPVLPRLEEALVVVMNPLPVELVGLAVVVVVGLVVLAHQIKVMPEDHQYHLKRAEVEAAQAQ